MNTSSGVIAKSREEIGGKTWRDYFEEFLSASIKDAQDRTMPDGCFRACVAAASMEILQRIAAEKEKAPGGIEMSDWKRLVELGDPRRFEAKKPEEPCGGTGRRPH